MIHDVSEWPCEMPVHNLIQSRSGVSTLLTFNYVNTMSVFGGWGENRLTAVV